MRYHAPRSLLALAACLLAETAAFAQPTNTPVPAAPDTKLFEPANLALPKLSPNGHMIGMLRRFDDMHFSLMLLDLQTGKQTPIVKAPNMTVTDFWWKSDDLLLIMIEEDGILRSLRSFDLRTQKFQDFQSLIRTGVRLLDRLPDVPEEVLIGLAPAQEETLSRTPEVPNPLRLVRENLRTERETSVETNAVGVERWLINRRGEAVGAWGLAARSWYLMWRSSPQEKWNRIEQPKDHPPEWVAVAVAADQRRFIVLESKQHPASRFCLLDPATGAMEEIPGAAGVDAADIWYWGYRDEAAVVHYETDQDSFRFLNPEAEEVYGWLGALLPGVQIQCTSFSQDNQKFLVRAWSAKKSRGVFFVRSRHEKIDAVRPDFQQHQPEGDGRHAGLCLYQQ